MAGLQGGGEEWGVWRGRKEQGTAPPVGAAGGRRRTPDPISPPASAAGGSGPRRQAPSAPAPRRAPPPRRQARARARAGCSGAGYSGMAMLKLKHPCTRRSGIDRMAGAMMSVIAAFTMIIAVTSMVTTTMRSLFRALVLARVMVQIVPNLSVMMATQLTAAAATLA